MIRTVIVGGGYWGQNLRRVVSRSERMDLWAVVDQDPRIGQHRTLDEAIVALGRIDAVIVATPASTHAEIALGALESGCHVLVEKPLALSSADGEKLCAAARDADRVLMVDHTYLYSPRFDTFQFVLDLWGPWKGWSSVREHDGGPSDVSSLWDLLPHDLAMLHACGFRARTARVSGDAEVGLLDLRGVDGLMATVIYGRRSKVKRRLIGVGTEHGPVTWDDLAELPLRIKRGKDDVQDLTVTGRHEPLAGLLDDFVDACEGRECRYPARSTGSAAVWGLRIIEAAERSILSGDTETI